MSLKLYRPGPQGLEPNPAAQRTWRSRLVSRRWKPASLENPELNPTSSRMAVPFWLVLATLTFFLIVIGYGTGFWSVDPPPTAGGWSAGRLVAQQGPAEPSAYTFWTVPSLLSRLFEPKDRSVKQLQPLINEINSLEPEFQALTDDEIRQRMIEMRDEVREDAAPTEPSEEELTNDSSERRRELRRAREKADLKHLQGVLDDVLPEVFAAAREISRRKLGMRHFDVQLIGGAVLHQGRIAEMRTGEGKTLVAPLAAALNAMSGRGVHVVTVNDYLAKRDPQWMGPIFHGLGLTVGIIQHESAFMFDPDHRGTDERLIHLRPVERAEAYAADVTYGTNNEFGFDYLRDNMVTELDERVQRDRYFAIVDEVDNILIDEARTPLIISGQAEESEDLYYQFARLVPRLRERREDWKEGDEPTATTSSTSRSTPSRPRRRASTRSSACSRSTTCSTPTRAWPATSSRRSGPTRCTSATATTSSRTARSSSSTSSPGARCPAGAGRRDCTRRSRPRRACASSASR